MTKLIFFLSFMFAYNTVQAHPDTSACKTIREAVVKPTMNHMNIQDDVLEDLLVGIAATESMSGKYLKQFRGPARGLMQIEESTYTWLIESGKVDPIVFNLGDSYDDITKNHFYSVAIAISLLFWRMDSYPLPEKDYKDNEEYMEYIGELGQYWKITFNTHLGKGTVNKFKSRWFENGCYIESEDWG